MQFTIYKSTDGSAPVLTGQNGKLRDLIKACLVDGYGSKAAAGWAQTYTGTNKGVFRAASGARLYYRIQDDAPGAGAAKEARLVGYETMSDVDTGTGPFPTVAQAANGLFVRKSATADATARAWIIAADARTAYVFIATGDSGTAYLSFMIGEFYSLVSSDAYNGAVIARENENSGSAAVEYFPELATTTINTNLGHYFPRGHTGTGAAINFGKTGDYSKAQGRTSLDGLAPYTNPADGGAYLAPVWIHDPTTTPGRGLRGRMRGLWQFLHVPGSVADGDTISGTGTLSGKTFLFVKALTSASAGAGATLATIETSATLETN